MEQHEHPQFDEWAIVELFGHQKMAGHVTQAPIGDMLRIDVHDTEDKVLYTRFVNPKAIYAINPVTMEVALAVGARFAQPPVQRWDLPQLAPAPETVTLRHEDEDADFDGDDPADLYDAGF